MSKEKSNGISTMSDSSKKVTIINGVEYPWVKGIWGCSITTTNGKVFIDGFELNKNGQWKKNNKSIVVFNILDKEKLLNVGKYIIGSD